MSDELLARLRTEVPHSARIWNYWLGGKDNFEADRRLGEQILGLVPRLVASARADRAFLGRAVRHLAMHEGVHQFLDIGTGIPTGDHTHEVAQRVVPEARIVYVDNDPMVLTHARALLRSTPEGRTDYVDADLHDPDAILREAWRTLDPARPVAVMLLSILNFVLDDGEAAGIVRRLLAAVASGSYLVVSHPTGEVDGAEMAEAVALWNRNGSAPMVLRSQARLAALCTGLDLVEPGVVSCSRWRPELDEDQPPPPPVPHYAAVGRKP
ncbi:MAG TPA: SAM-dependent methyltransferase [Rugosimonospora sp.]|nr:SAM-dependent methyltransferase [Rugosimonospora sp.]